MPPTVHELIDICTREFCYTTSHVPKSDQKESMDCFLKILAKNVFIFKVLLTRIPESRLSSMLLVKLYTYLHKLELSLESKMPCPKYDLNL